MKDDKQIKLVFVLIPLQRIYILLLLRSLQPTYIVDTMVYSLKHRASYVCQSESARSDR